MATSSTFSTDNQYIKYRIVVTESNVSIPNNTSTINVKVDAWRTNTGYTTSGTGTCYCTIAGTKYSQSISASQEIKHNSHTVLFNRTINNFPHNADGSRSIYVQAKINHSRFDSSYHGFTVNLAKIPRSASITGAINFTDEGIPQITFSNPAGEAVESLRAGISLSDSVENLIVAFRNVSPLAESYSFDLTAQERDALRASMPNANTRSIFYILETVIGGATYYSQQEAQLSIVNGNPVASGITYEDVNSATKAITLNDQLIIQNKSSVKFSFSSITAQKFAQLALISIKINSVVRNYSISGSSVIDQNCSFGEIDSASNQTAEITITDSRGNSQNYSVNVSMLEWHIPSAIVKASRVSNFYTQTIIMADADYSSLDGKNTISITWEYKERTASSYTSGGSLVDAQPITFNLDNEKAWDVRFNIADLIDSRVYNVVVEIGIPIVFFDKNKRSMGINKFPSRSSSLEIKGDAFHDGDIVFDDSGTSMRGIRGILRGSDQIRLAGGASASDDGFLELATAGDGNEPIKIRQYSGDFQNIEHEIELMDAYGHTNLNYLFVQDIVASGDIVSSGMPVVHSYRESAQGAGFWEIGGQKRFVFEETVVLGSLVTINANTWYTFKTLPEGSADRKIVDIVAFSSSSGGYTVWKCVAGQYLTSTRALGIYNARSSAISVDTITYRWFVPPTE